MPHFQFIVLVCAGLLAILGAVKIVTEAIVRKDSTEIKQPCGDKFRENSDKIVQIEKDANERKDRILILEINYKQILEKIGRIETAMEKNVTMTAQIYAFMAKRKSNGLKHK